MLPDTQIAESQDSVANNEEKHTGRVLVVDDHAATRTMHRAILAKRFDVLTASSGEEALAICAGQLPDLVLLDVEMPGLDGFDTCRKLRERSNVPIIFATSHDAIEEHLKAFDAGGEDIVVKPVSAEILLRKVSIAINQHKTREALQQEKASLHSMAMSFLSTMGESGVLLQFTRSSLECRTHDALATLLVEAIRSFGVQCTVAIRHRGEETIVCPESKATELERSILRQLTGMGRMFQFKNRFVINYDQVSIVVSDMPDSESEQAGRIRDNIAVLAETTEALSENVSMRRESSARAEAMQLALGRSVETVNALRSKHQLMITDVRMTLQELTDSVEQTYSWLATDRSVEMQINNAMKNSVERVFQVLLSGAQFDNEFAQLISNLSGGDAANDAELF